MTETPFYFPNAGYSLFGVLHEPARATHLPAFVFCHPFGEEKLWAHRVFVSFARQLASGGHPVLRFDYMGSGDSDGSFSQSSMTTALSDVRRAMDEVRRRTKVERVNLLGLRLGASIASLVAEATADIDRLVLWAPIVDGSRYLQELLRINLTTQMAVHREIRQDREALVAGMQAGQTVNVDGYDMALQWFSDVSAIKLSADPKRHEGPCLVTQIDRQPGRPSAELGALAACYGRATLSFAQEEPFWKEIARFYDTAPSLFATTSEWLNAR